MVLNARNSGGSIRPILGSAFAAPEYGNAPEPLEMHEELIPKGGPQLESHPQPHSQRASVLETPRNQPAPAEYPVPASDDAISDVRVPAAGKVRRHEVTLFRPLVERSHHEESMEPRAIPAETPRPREETREAAAPRQTSPATAVERFEPLIALKPEPPPRLDVSAPAAVFQNNRKPIAGAAARQTASTPPPDEIQINIGRIEITAVPPAPVRAAPKPASQSPDLGAYLKGRNGSAR